MWLIILITNYQPRPHQAGFLVMANVDIFTTKWLAQQWCKGKCNYKGEDVCNPQFFAQGILGLGLNIRVTGKMPMSECPIACRVFPKPNHTPVQGTGDCGNTPTENPMD